MTRLEAASRPIRWIVRESREANRTDFARIRKADANSTISQPRYGRNQPPLNHDSTILRVESKNDSDSIVPHPRSLNRQYRAAWPWLVHQLPRPSRHFLHHPRREGNRQAAGNGNVSADGGEKRKTLEKWAFRGACPSSFPQVSRIFAIARPLSGFPARMW